LQRNSSFIDKKGKTAETFLRKSFRTFKKLYKKGLSYLKFFGSAEDFFTKKSFALY